MNAHTNIQSAIEADYLRDWTLDPRVAPLLSSCAANPPRRIVYSHGLYSEYRDGALVKDQSEYNSDDPRVWQLSKIMCEQFCQIDHLSETSPEFHDRLRATWYKCQPDMEAAIDRAIALAGDETDARPAGSYSVVGMGA